MRRSSSFAVTIACALLAGTGALARADGLPDSMPRSYAGLQLLAISGVHRDAGVNQYGVGAGPLGEIRFGGRRLALHVEGIPVVGIPTRASTTYGQATPALGVFNGEAEFAVDTRARLWAGVGATVYNQRTPLPAMQQEVSSRLAGMRYSVRYREPLRAGQFLEGTIGAAPTLFGVDRYLYSDGVTPPVNKDERASEIDASLAFGWHHASTEWLVGLRTLNFSAHFVATNDAADRNVGTGLMVEWRHLIRQ